MELPKDLPARGFINGLINLYPSVFYFLCRYIFISSCDSCHQQGKAHVTNVMSVFKEQSSGWDLHLKLTHMPVKYKIQLLPCLLFCASSSQSEIVRSGFHVW